MKEKKLIMLATVLLIMFSSFSSFIFAEIVSLKPGEEGADNEVKGINKIPRVDSITIDGNPQDWSGIPVFMQLKDREENYSSSKVIVKSIKLAHNGTHLLVLVECAGNVDDYFKNNKRRATIIGKIFLDTDNNLNTGATEFFSKERGFESSIELATGIILDKGSSRISGTGGVSDDVAEEGLKYFIVRTASLYNDSSSTIGGGPGGAYSDKKPELISYIGNYIETKVSFKIININPAENKMIRVMYKDFYRDSRGSCPTVLGEIE